MLYAQNQGNHWYVDNGCSKHITSHKNKFLSLKEDSKGNVTFGNFAPRKIMGKGKIGNLVNGRGKEKNVLFVEGLKHNLLSVS